MLTIMIECNDAGAQNNERSSEEQGEESAAVSIIVREEYERYNSILDYRVYYGY